MTTTDGAQSTDSPTRSDPLALTPEEQEKAQVALSRAAQEGADKLTSQEQVDVLKHLNIRLHRDGESLSPEERQVVHNIYRSIPDDEMFTKDDAAKREALVGQMFEDKAIQDAEKNWRYMTDDEKLAALSRAVEIHASIYGEDLPTLEFKEMEDSKGRYDEATNAIYINPDPKGFRVSVDGAFETAIHEAAHAYQRKLAQDYWKGRLEPSDPRYRQAELFALNSGKLYFIGQDSPEKEYSSQPSERYAGAAGASIYDRFAEMFRNRMERELGKQR